MIVLCVIPSKGFKELDTQQSPCWYTVLIVFLCNCSGKVLGLPPTLVPLINTHTFCNGMRERVKCYENLRSL
jgi:hypothetical protein